MERSREADAMVRAAGEQLVAAVLAGLESPAGVSRVKVALKVASRAAAARRAAGVRVVAPGYGVQA